MLIDLLKFLNKLKTKNILFLIRSTKCYDCASNCAVCSGETNTECISCMTGYAFQGHDCLSIQYLSSQCLSNQYFKDIECTDCDISCKTCNGGTNQNCIECSKGYMMSNGYCMACNQVYGMKTDDSGNCVPIIANKCSCPSGEICDQNNKCIPASPTCNLATFKSNVITLYCSQSVYFQDTIQDNLFSFSVVGSREVYDFEIKLIDNIQLGVAYQSLKFMMTPYSTYIGLNNEVLILKFIQPEKIVSSTSPKMAISNSQTNIGINDPSDAIPVSADVISRTFGYIVGFGTAASFATTLGLKICFGCNFNLGWGLINFIQIIAFIPLANFYFPGNVRSYVSILKIVNTAGQGMPNIL